VRKSSFERLNAPLNCATREAAHHAQEQALPGIRYSDVTTRFVILALAVGFAVVAAVSLYRTYATPQGIDQPTPVDGHISGTPPPPEALLAGWADENVRDVQMKLREGGFYSGEIDGAYGSELAAALTRYQIRNGLPITGQLDVDTSKTLGAKPAVATSADDRARSSEAWRRLRMGDQATLAKTNARVTPSPGAEPPRAPVTSAQSSPAAYTGGTTQPETQSIGSPSTEGSTTNISTERVRDYVGAFVLAGLDPRVGAETDFFADRVRYYDEGVIDREKIRRDLQRYAARWPERRFWLDGDITVEPQNDNRIRVTFPLRYELRKGDKHSSGKIDKTIVLEPAGDDLEIVAVNERKAK
jgi:peptidoglycan hydrolase-like protein with peptidoglycan-binding domain